jgi:hypothetical protein
MSDHFGVYNFVNQSDPLDAWKPKDMADLINNIVRNPANADRTIQIKGWPGPLIGERMRLIRGWRCVLQEVIYVSIESRMHSSVE